MTGKIALIWRNRCIPTWRAAFHTTQRIASTTLRSSTRTPTANGHLLVFNSVTSYSNEKIFFQSFFMLMTVQFFSFASA
jgi:hypothetical protein